MTGIFGGVIAGVLLLAAAPLSAQAVDANAEAKALAQCFVLKTTGQDRLTFARWMIGGLASGPQAADIVTVNKPEKIALDHQMARLFTRLMTQDCLVEARPMFQAKNSEALKFASGTLGRIAMQELLSDPSAAAAIGAFAQYLNEDDFKPLKP